MPIAQDPYCENELGLSGVERDKKALHPPSSPDMVSFNFYRFRDVTQLITGHKLLDQAALLDAAQDILRVVKSYLGSRFLAEMERLERRIIISADLGE
jgi:hypothetical protein